MLSTSASIAFGFVFVLLGGINVWLVLESWARAKQARISARLLAMHRIGGYLFIALFCVMGYFMTARLRDGSADGSPAVALHLALVMILSPLLFVKALIARKYRNQHNVLVPLGLTIFVLAFVLVASTALPYLARASKIERVSIDPAHVPPVTIDLNQAGDLMQKRCGKCHNLDRVIGARKDAAGWVTTVNRMRAMPGAGISEDDARTIASYLQSQNRAGGSESAAKMEISRALVDQRCGRCHALDRVYGAVQTSAEWHATVSRMAAYAAGSAGALQPGEEQRIEEYLSATQTPEARNHAKAQIVSAPSGKPSASTGESAVGSSRYDLKTIGFISFVCLAAVTLTIRRPASEAKREAPLAFRPAGGPFLLELVRITPQTPDARTLRFAVKGPRTLDAKPGQFLTFSFLFDGRKETRCYSICSSTARSGYVEITPKRVSNGCVSVFLNDRASIGMTVEATGPFGEFCLHPEDDQIVLIAAGSGITPMLSMLRYLDDLCLNTHATLLYCVRTTQDIIFQRELNELQARLRNFHYRVLLSQPDPKWEGARGHISREFVRETVPEMAGRVFFLCGPPPFMEAARGILAEMGVEPERIRQESFGGTGALQAKTIAPQASESAFIVEFARSSKILPVLPGQTLLQIAAENGIEIPSSCRQGQCGTCKTRLLAGSVRMTAEHGLDPDSKAAGFVLPCVGHAEGHVTLDA